MIFTILISIVFISEVIIAIFLLTILLKLDRAVLGVNEIVIEAKPGVREISRLVLGISGQMKEFAIRFADKVKTKRDDYISIYLVKVLLFVLLWKNAKKLDKLRKSKFAKTLGKGLSLLEIVV